ncbi:MAG: alpha/beta hydrolase-fold protein [Gemmatimonadota bacterium]
MRVGNPRPAYLSRRGTAWVLLFLVALQSGCSSTPSEPDRPEDESRIPGWVYSHEVGDSFRIYVHLPEGYSTADGPETHLVVLLDADWYMDGSHVRLGNGGVVGIVERLAGTGSIPPVAVLGIGEINRRRRNMRGRDFLTAPDRFIRFISSELLPRFFAEFAPDGGGFEDLTLMGHSDGGYFAVWTLFRDAPPLFRNVVAISGDFTKPHYDVLALEEDYHDRGPTERVCLYLGVGAEEEDRFLSGFARLVEAVESRVDSTLGFGSRIYEDLDHGTVVGPAFSDGLRFSFSGECLGTSSKSERTPPHRRPLAPAGHGRGRPRGGARRRGVAGQPPSCPSRRCGGGASLGAEGDGEATRG